MRRSLGGPVVGAALIALVAVAGPAVLVDLAASPASAMSLAQRPTATPQPDYGRTPCRAFTSTDVEPGSILTGETLAVTRTISSVCAGMLMPLHIVLVLDGTASMEGEPHEALERAVGTLVEVLARDLGPAGRVGVVVLGERVEIACPLTERMDRIRRCTDQVGAQGNATLADGLDAAMRAMDAGVALWPGIPREDIREAIVVLSGASDFARCQDAIRRSNLASARGMLVAAACVGPRCDRACSLALATSGRYRFSERSIDRLLEAIEPRRPDGPVPSPRTLVVTETLAAGVELVSDSARPRPSRVLTEPTRLEWHICAMPAEGITLTYRVQPTGPGYQTLSAGMRGTFVDYRQRPGAFTFDVPWARVLGEP